jgi:general nucleoside transport system ATP-binding protein
MSYTGEEITSLRVEGLTKRFPGVLACDNISLSIGKNEILALVGENGAGKTTLMNILMGLYHPDEGKILINDRDVNFKSPNDAFQAGIGMVHQRYMLVPNLTVVENIALGMKEAHRRGLVDPSVVRKKIQDVSEQYGLAVDPDAYVWQLSVGEQQRVELVKTLCYGARFLILDEPTSALTPQETDELIILLRSMASELSIIFISHKLQEVKALSHKVAILRHGKVVFSGDTEDYTPSELASFMTGNTVELPTNKHENTPGDTILDIQSLRVKSDRGFYALDGLDLNIRAGEIVGLAGVSGNGQKELAEVINGIRKADEGSVLFKNQNIVNKTPGEIIRAGMGYIPEDRNTEGIIPSFSIKENLILKDNSEEKYSHNHFLKLKKISESAERLKEEFDIRCPHINLSAGALSGGNIQKVILAREIDRSPLFLVAVYPTRGLDMGAIEFIHKQLLSLKEKGIGVLLISEELEEIINLSDRVAVIYKGKIMKTLKGSDATKQKLGLLMAGVSDDN